MCEQGEQCDSSQEGRIWQSNGALEILLLTLGRVDNSTRILLAKDDSIIARGKALIAKYIEPLVVEGYKGRLEDKLSVQEQTELLRLNFEILNWVATLSSDVRTANLMAAIDLEAAVNQFLCLHLDESVVDHIDRLSVVAKLEIAHAVLGKPKFKGSGEQGSVKRLFDWRDAFVHGKLPGISTNRALKDIHLRIFREIGPADPQRELNEMLALLDGYLAVRKHLRAISTRPSIFSTPFDFSHVEQALQSIKAIRQVKFKNWYLTETEKQQAAAERARL
ncbi:MAG TPA: hypothetical protein VFL91_05890 [Thermomicrobiales bacterium]|nr:hypothetical protein [Thermomicrobiales bacterium]